MATAGRFSVGLIGCGDVAERYGRALTGDGEMRLETVWDTDRDAGERFAERFGVRPLPSLDDLQAAPLALVCICTPNATHARLAARCLEAGRDVLVEHPLATSLADARALCGIAAARRRHLFVIWLIGSRRSRRTCRRRTAPSWSVQAAVGDLGHT